MVSTQVQRFSLFYCSWVNPLLYKGFKKELEQNDLYEVLEEDQSDVLGNKLQRLENFYSRAIKIIYLYNFISLIRKIEM